MLELVGGHAGEAEHCIGTGGAVVVRLLESVVASAQSTTSFSSFLVHLHSILLPSSSSSFFFSFFSTGPPPPHLLRAAVLSGGVLLKSRRGDGVEFVVLPPVGDHLVRVGADVGALQTVVVGRLAGRCRC